MATAQDLKPPRTAHARYPPLARKRPPALSERLTDLPRREPLLLVFIAGALVARIVFWLTTNRMFEDGLTTITHARNVPLGLGLIHHLGEGHVHGFTSALGVLIPLVGELIREGSGMDTMRLASLAAVCVALVYARMLYRELGVSAVPTAFLLAYLAFDQNMIFFGMSGMETQVAVAVILAGIYHVRRHDFVAAGIWLGLAPLVRPEFVLWVAPAIVYLAIVHLRRATTSAAISAAIVIPWLIFTTLYYGSPVPNTIIAKNTIYPVPPLIADGSIAPFLGQIGGHLVLLIYKLEPFQEVWSTVATPVPGAVLAAVAVATAYFVVLGLVAARTRRDMWPVVAFLGLFLAYRILFIPAVNYYDWYMPPFMAVVMMFAAMGMQRMSISFPMPPKAVAVTLGVAFAIHMPFSFVAESRVQAIEDQVRTNVGLYLKANVQPGQSVVSESAGYIGFYGGVKLYDYPGLTSPTSVRALQGLPPNQRDLAGLISVLQPDWLVLRPWELGSLNARFPGVAALYQVQRVFVMPGIPDSDLDVRGATVIDVAGYRSINIDAKFTVLKRT